MKESSAHYDAISYESFAYPQSHPERLGTIATLFGMQPARPGSARILELGCAGGGNLLPMAAAYPESEFVGIDLSLPQIEEARAALSASKLSNVTLHSLSIGQVDETFGQFDYIIAHGLYSWVAAPLRDQLMALCAGRLTPMGVAYISYNTQPGSAARTALREMVRFRTRQSADLREKITQARSFFAFLQSAFQESPTPYTESLREEIEQLNALGDFYIAHEYLEPINDACYFHEFVSHAQCHGLQFLGEAEMQSMSASGFGTQTRAGLRQLSTSLIEAEQYGDFLKNRAFRQSLLCRAEVELKRAISPERLRHFHIASSAEPMGSDGGIRSNEMMQFRDADGVIIQAADPLSKAALFELRAVWPLSMSLTELALKACARGGIAPGSAVEAQLGHCLLSCYSTSRAIEFRLTPPAFRTSVSQRPKVSELARWQAARHSRIANARHENIVLGNVERALLQKLDGSRDPATLEREFPEARAILARFAGGAMLIG